MLRIELDKPEAAIQIVGSQSGRQSWSDEAGAYVANSHLGSISFPSYLFLQSPLKQAKKYWITLFDYIEDDVYDGDLTENDEETPRVLIQYKLTNEAATARKSQISSSSYSKVTKEQKSSYRTEP